MPDQPLSEINDIQALVKNKQKESDVLEYKEEVSGNDKQKKQFSKAVSAMANTNAVSYTHLTLPTIHLV